MRKEKSCSLHEQSYTISDVEATLVGAEGRRNIQYNPVQRMNIVGEKRKVNFKETQMVPRNIDPGRPSHEMTSHGICLSLEMWVKSGWMEKNTCEQGDTLCFQREII